MANPSDIIDYNGYQIASGALDDPTLQLLKERNLIPTEPPVMSEDPYAGMKPAGLMDVVTGKDPKAAGLIDTELFQRLQRPSTYFGGTSILEGLQTPSGNMVPVQPGDKALQLVSPMEAQQGMNPYLQMAGGYAPQNAEQKPQNLVQREMEATASAPSLSTPETPARRALTPYEQLIQGTTGKLRNEASQAKQIADIYATQAQQRGNLVQTMEDRWNQYKQAAAELDKKREEANKALDEAKTENYWDRKGSGQKLLAILSLGLGTFASGWKGTPNVAFQMLQDDIKQDYQLQRDAVEKAKGKVDRIDNDYARLLNVYKNEDMAQAAFFNLRTQQLQDKLEQIKSQGVADNVKNLIDMTVGDLRLKQQQNNMEMLKNFAEIKEKAGAGIEPPKEVLERYVPGVGIAATKEDATKVKDVAAGTLDQIDLIRELKDLTNGFQSINPATRSIINQKISLLTGKLRVPVVGPGAFTDSEREFIKNDIVGNPASLLSLDSITLQKLDNLEKTLTGARDRIIANSGIRPFMTEQEMAYDQMVQGNNARFGQQPQSSAADKGQPDLQQRKLMDDLAVYENMLKQNPNDKTAKEAVQVIKGLLGK